MITEAAIRKAIRQVEAGSKTAATLTDPAPRGAGRLALVVKPGRAEWYAQRWASGRRALQKLGSWPALSIAEARDRHAGIGATLADKAAVADLFDAYLQTLAGRSAYTEALRMLAMARDRIGGSRAARDIGPEDIVAALRPIYRERGAVTADRARSWLSAAFGWAVPAANDYTRETVTRWGVRRNPVLDVGRDASAKRVGTHWLRPPEFMALLDALQAGPANRTRTACLLLALTGQRGPQLRKIRADQWDSAERVLMWTAADMKLPKPHAIPVCKAAALALDALQPDADGYLLRVCRSSVQELLASIGLGTARDLRRTWKTLAASAGMTKTERDQYQAHGLAADVAELHYNRYEALPEKRAALAKWEAWLEQQLCQHRAKREAEQIVQAKQHAGRQ